MRHFAARLGMLALLCAAPLLLGAAPEDDGSDAGDGSAPSGGYENYYDLGDTGAVDTGGAGAAAEAIAAGMPPDPASLPAPWPGDAPLSDVAADGWGGLGFVMPEGGTFTSEEESGIDPSEDPMAYPIMWMNIEGSLAIDSLMLGVYDNGWPIYESQLWELNAQERTGYTKFPYTPVEPDVVELDNGAWIVTVLENEYHDNELAKLSTAVGSNYYSMIIRYASSSDPELVWSQIYAITGSLTLPGE